MTDIPAMPAVAVSLKFDQPYSVTNRKKHTRLKRLLMVLAVLLILLPLLHCAPKVPPLRIAPRPVQSQAVAPAAEKVRKQLGTAQGTVTELRSGLDAAVAESDRLRKAKAATEAELTWMWQTLTKEKERAVVLWDQLAESYRTVEELNRLAVERDLEIDSLRTLATHYEGQIKSADEWRKMAEPKVAIYDYWVGIYAAAMRKIYWIIGLSLVGMVIYIAVRYWPAIAARFLKPL